jgi:hypothetical protein
LLFGLELSWFWAQRFCFFEGAAKTLRHTFGSGARRWRAPHQAELGFTYPFKKTKPLEQILGSSNPNSNFVMFAGTVG